MQIIHTFHRAPFSLIKLMRKRRRSLRSIICRVRSGLGLTTSTSDMRTARLSCSAPEIRLSSSTSGGNVNKSGFYKNNVKTCCSFGTIKLSPTLGLDPNMIA